MQKGHYSHYRQAFDLALQAYDHQCGRQNTERFLEVGSCMLKWLRESGYGKISLPAIHHRIGDYLTIETVMEAPSAMALELVLTQAQLLAHGAVTMHIRDQNVLDKILISQIIELHKPLKGPPAIS